MNESFLKKNQLVVQTLSPVHIGTGDKLAKTDYILQNGKLVVIDENKLTSWISSQPNAEKMALVLADTLQRPDANIANFLRHNFSGSLADITAYRLPYEIEPVDLATFIKLHDHRPYLPGSSTKGVLRSALLRGKMLGDQRLRQEAVLRIAEGRRAGRDPKTNSDSIQASVFSKQGFERKQWPNYDINRLMMIRDSDPIDGEEVLEAITVKTFSLDAKRILKPKEYSICVEALKPRLLITQAIIWQTNLLSREAEELGFAGLEELMVFLPEYCRRVSMDLLNQEYNFYRNHGQSEVAGWFEARLNSLAKASESVFILPMGWGSGYDAKTITDLLGKNTFKNVVDTYKNTRGLGYPGNRKGLNWLGPVDAPKSRKLVVHKDGRLLPMGWVAMRFNQADSQPDWMADRRAELAEHKPSSEIPIFISLDSSTTGTAPQPKQPTIPPEPPPIKAPLIPSFSPQKMPKPGDRFEGTVFAEEENIIFLEIPGLDPDSEGYAVLNRREYPLLGAASSGQRMVCETVSLKEEGKGYWRITCRLG